MTASTPDIGQPELPVPPDNSRWRKTPTSDKSITAESWHKGEPNYHYLWVMVIIIAALFCAGCWAVANGEFPL